MIDSTLLSRFDYVYSTVTQNVKISNYQIHPLFFLTATLQLLQMKDWFL